jgi:hypothetical protein
VKRGKLKKFMVWGFEGAKRRKKIGIRTKNQEQRKKSGKWKVERS